MERGYGSELGAISFAAGISSDHMASYLDGSVPRSREVVEKMERSLGIETNRMVSAWDWDALEAIDSIYPIPEGMLPEIANLIEAVRLATSHLNGLGPVRQALKKGGFPSWNIYTRWNDLYKARVTPFSYRHFYRHVPDILIASGIMSAAEAIVTLEEAASAKVDMEISTEDLESAAERALADGRIVAEAWMDPEGVTTLRIISEVIHHSFKFLTMREEEVVRMSMGLGYSREYSFEEIGDIFDVSRERIRYIVMKALRKLRHLVFSKRLKDLWRG